jgi:hypothetical protein
MCKKYFPTPKSIRLELMTLSLLVDLPVSLRYKNSFKISSTERPSTSPSTRMKLSHTELPFKLLSLVEPKIRNLMKFFFSMLHHSPSVSKLLEVS